MFQKTAVALWITSQVAINFCTYFRTQSLLGPEYDKLGNAFYIALVRPIWSLAMSWVILACTFGYGGKKIGCQGFYISFYILGFFDFFFSLPVLQVLGRLAYSQYLIHVTMIYLKIFSAKSPWTFSDIEIVNDDYISSNTTEYCVNPFSCISFAETSCLVWRWLWCGIYLSSLLSQQQRRRY